MTGNHVDRSRAFVVTTIFPPTQAMEAIADGAAAKGDHVFVAGDAKGPEEFDLDGVVLLDLAAQERFRLGRIAPTGSYARKNIAYLAAMESGVDVIIETDDDNIPRAGFFESRSRTRSVPLVAAPGWCNVYEYFTDSEFAWPRGYPLELLHPGAPGGDPAAWAAADVDAPIQQGLADGDPDVDAVFRMTRPLPLEFRTNLGVALGEGVWCPFNSQNTTWFRDAFQLLYLPSHCSFRMTDIWRSFVAQRVAWANGWNIVFDSPTVWQDRNEHDLLKDFEQEIPGYLNNARISEAFDALSIPDGLDAIGAAMTRCYDQLIDMGLVGEPERQLLEVWLEESADRLA